MRSPWTFVTTLDVALSANISWSSSSSPLRVSVRRASHLTSSVFASMNSKRVCDKMFDVTENSWTKWIPLTQAGIATCTALNSPVAMSHFSVNWISSSLEIPMAFILCTLVAQQDVVWRHPHCDEEKAGRRALNDDKSYGALKISAPSSPPRHQRRGVFDVGTYGTLQIMRAERKWNYAICKRVNGSVGNVSPLQYSIFTLVNRLK